MSIMIHLYDATGIAHSHGPYTPDNMPWDHIRMWQTRFVVATYILHNA